MSIRATFIFMTLISAKVLITPPALHAEQILLPDGRIFLPQPPVDNSYAQAADIQAFEKTRILKDSSRWQLAQNDADLKPEHVIDDFSCAAGFRILPNDVPTLISVLDLIEKPLELRITEEKDNWQRKRPFIGKNKSICTPDANKLSASFSYPSGHTTWGWLVASILSSALPDRSTYIMQRGRVFGESRIVCGVHWKSDVQAGYMNGGAMFAALQEQPWFAEKMKIIRKELQGERLKAMPLNNTTCSIEHEASKEIF